MFQDMNERWKPHQVLPLFYETTYEAPRNWQHYKVARQAFNMAFHDASLIAPEWPNPVGYQHRGITICGGGWRFFPSVYVTIRMIRETGCDMPIQVWCLGDQGEFDPRMELATERFNVEWVNAQKFARERGITKRQWGGWQIKSFAALHSPFMEVVCLDADCYPVYDPNLFLDSREHRAIGATFWPDISRLTKAQWEHFNVPYRDEPAIESGQFAIDKTRHYKALWLADWLNDRSDYVYSHIYGDKDTFHLAWRKLGVDYCLPNQLPRWESVGFTHKDFQGNIVFIHRIGDKFKWFGSVDGKPIEKNYTSRQMEEQKFIVTLPYERECHRWVAECSEMIRPEAHFEQWADRGFETDIEWISVVQSNSYGLSDSLKGQVVVDETYQDNAFVFACLHRDVEHVYLVGEPRFESDLRQHVDRYTFIDSVDQIPDSVKPSYFKHGPSLSQKRHG